MKLSDDMEASKESSDFHLELGQQEDTTVPDKVLRSLCLSANVPHALEVSQILCYKTY